MYQIPSMWHSCTSRDKNVYVAFHTEVAISTKDHYEMLVFGHTIYRVYLDGTEILQGPARFDKNHAEYDIKRLELAAGMHRIMVIVHFIGHTTMSTTGELPAFLHFELKTAHETVPLNWKCKELDAFIHLNRRTNEGLGWMEYCDTRLMPEFDRFFSTPDWLEPVLFDQSFKTCTRKSIHDCLAIPVDAVLLRNGLYTNRFGYENDDPPMRFLLRNLQPSLPHEGVWFLFDMGKAGLYRPQIELEVAAGTVIEAGYNEWLVEGRVAPVITNGGFGSYMDRWIAKGGRQTLTTFTPRGYRFMEIHLAAPAEQAHLLKVTSEQRTYFSASRGSFHCSDPLLDRIWQMSVDTLQACSEDTITDCPTRERGQYIGDAMVGLETVSISFGDFSLLRRSLIQATHSAHEDGPVPAIYPGETFYITSFSLIWIQICLRYYQLTGDRTLLEETYETARKSILFFLYKMSERGITWPEAWDFLDWGHMIGADEIDVSLNVLLLESLRDFQAWSRILARDEQDMDIDRSYRQLESTIRSTYMTSEGLLAKSVPMHGEIMNGQAQAGYHANVLGLRLHLFNQEQISKVVSFIKNHMLSCFPNNPNAPRLAPGANHPQLITPYFAHFALQALWEAGETDFVLEQYRRCWGWMIETGATTLLEVFDTRWSHCHQWSGCPAWQLSRNLLGIFPDQSGDPYRFHWNPKLGNLQFVEGTIPLQKESEVVSIKCNKMENGHISYRMDTNHPISIIPNSLCKIVSCTVDGMKVESILHELYISTSVQLEFY